jgi:organic hydroperoxide reductase OsmC/OhrA
MLIEARVENQHRQHTVSLTTNGSAHALQVAPRPSGFGSSANGGELLCLALATCYCNDVYREAEKRGIAVIRVEVEAQAEFDAVGEPAHWLRYRANVFARAAAPEILELMLHTDRVAEVQKICAEASRCISRWVARSRRRRDLTRR